MIGAAATPDWTDCVSPCRCKWASGKKTAICSSSGLTNLPILNSDVQVLDLQGNFITYLDKDAFSAIDLLNLQKIFMKNTTVKEIHRDAFRDLKILIEVDLSYNQIASIPRGTFAGNDRLKILTLSGNPLRIISSEQFPILPHLRILDLENCKIEEIQNGAFIHLSQLENLNLKANLLQTSSKTLFKPIINLKSLDLIGNPWRCDCDLRDFRNWYLTSNLHSVSLSCNEPAHHRGVFWEDIPSMEFACLAEVIVGKSVYERRQRDNVTFSCSVKGDPEPEVTWLFNEHSIGSVNTTRNNPGFLVEVERGFSEKWINLTLINLTESDAGEYVCQAKSFYGTINKNVSLVLTDSRFKFSDANYIFLFAGLLVTGLLILVMIFTAIACSCMSYSRTKRKSRRRTNSTLKGSKSYYDQEKHLLDMSTSNTEQQSRKSSCEILNTHPSVELLKHSFSMPIERYEPVHYIHRRPIHEDSTKMIQLTCPLPNALGVYPPPPEFSNNVQRSETMGNIYISVALTPDPSVTIETYPDLLDVHRPSTSSTIARNLGQHKSSSFCGLSVVPYATLPRKQITQRIVEHPQPCVSQARPNPSYDNMGKRVTIGGSSTLSLPDEYELIPTPPPPPLSSNPDSDFVPL